MEYPNAWGRERLVREVTALKKKVAELEEEKRNWIFEASVAARKQEAHGEKLREFVLYIATLRNDPKDRKGKRWDILSDVLNSLSAEAQELTRDVAAEFAALAASQPPIPPDIRSRMDADRKRAELERDLLRTPHEGAPSPLDADE